MESPPRTRGTLQRSSIIARPWQDFKKMLLPSESGVSSLKSSLSFVEPPTSTGATASVVFTFP